MAATKAKTAAPQLTPLLVTTNKGVFFGYGSYKLGDRDITLTKCRNVIYWAKSVKGFLGLAVTGPDASCRIGPAAPSTIVIDITSVSECTPEAVAAFEKAPWGG